MKNVGIAEVGTNVEIQPDKATAEVLRYMVRTKQHRT